MSDIYTFTFTLRALGIIQHFYDSPQSLYGNLCDCYQPLELDDSR